MKKVFWVFTLALLSGWMLSNTVSGQTPVPMGSQPGLSYTENFSDITNWTNNFASGVGANRFASVAVNATGTIPDGTRTSVSSATFAGASTTGGIQRGGAFSNPAGTIVMLSTGATDNTSAVAFDFFMDYTGVNAGTLSFDWASVNNTTGDRRASLRIYWSIDGTTFTEIPSAAVLNFTNNSPTSGSITAVALPAAFNNNPNARLRFYQYNGSGGTTGSRPKISIDNLNVTATGTTPNLSIDDVTQTEGNAGTATFAFTVNLSAPAGAGGVTFDIATQDNTATTADNDYVANSLTGQTIPAGNSSYTFNVTVNGDTAIEPNEIFFVNVTNVVGANVSDGQASGTITNDDFDTVAPAIVYTALQNTLSTANPTLTATVTDAVGIPTAGGFVPRIYYRKNSDAYVSNACSLASGTGQNGTWDCVVNYSLIGGVANDAITYFVIAQDDAGNIASNPGGALATDVNTVSAAPPAPNLYTIGQGAVPAGAYTYLSLGDSTTLSGNASASVELTIGGIVDTNGNTLTIGCGGTINGGSNTEYIIGNVEKFFCAAGSFTFPVGTQPDGLLSEKLKAGAAPEYSPLTAGVTAGTFPSSLTVTVIDAFLSGVDQTQSASRYWDVTENGDLTADLSFTYLDADINGAETSFQVLRRLGVTTNSYPGGTIDVATNTGNAPGVQSTSSWSVGRLAVTAANASIGGRVTTAGGRPLSGVSVMITGGGLTEPRYFRTNSFGKYQFNDLPVGESYVVTVAARKYYFPAPSRVINLQEDVVEANFEAENR